MRKTPAEWIEIVNKASSEVGTMSIVNLAEKYEVNCEILRTKLRQAGFTERRKQDHSLRIKQIDEPLASEIIEKYLSGVSLVRINKQFKVSYGQIDKLFTERLVPMRTQEEASSLFISQRSPELIAEAGRKNGDTLRGRKKSEEELIRRASNRSPQIGRGEDELFEVLNSRQLSPQRQLPAGKYNIDLTVGRTAIEVETGGMFQSDLQTDFYRDRCEWVFTKVDHLVIVMFREFDYFLRDLDQIVTKIEEITETSPKIIRLYSLKHSLQIDQLHLTSS